MTGTVVAVNKLYSIYAHFQSADQNTSKTADILITLFCHLCGITKLHAQNAQSELEKINKCVPATAASVSMC